MHWKPWAGQSPRYDLLLVAVCSAATTTLAIQYYYNFSRHRGRCTHCGSSVERNCADSRRLEVTEESPSPVRDPLTAATASSTVVEGTSSDTVRCGTEESLRRTPEVAHSTVSSPCPHRSGEDSTSTAINERGNNCIHEACLSNRVEVLRLACHDALDRGVSQSLMTASNSMGYSPLHIAGDMGHGECVRELLRYAPEFVKLEVADSRGLTPLALASGNGDEACVEILLDAGADPNTGSLRGFTALHVACERGASRRVVELLLSHGANLESRSRRGSTPLFVAAQQGHAELVDCLLARGSCVSATHDSGATPLFIAAQNGHQDVVRSLLTRDPNRRMSRSTACGGYTPLHVASDRGHFAVVKVMLCFGRCNPDLVTSGGRTALHLAAARGYHDIVALLVKEGCNVDARVPSTGETALHLAKKLEGGGDTIEALLRGGCSTVLKPRINNIPRPRPTVKV